MPLSIRAFVAVRPHVLLATLLAFPLAVLLGAAGPSSAKAQEKDNKKEDNKKEDNKKEDNKKEDKEPEAVAPNVEVRFLDGSSLKVKVTDKELPLKTPYGKLTVPVEKVNELDCCTRLPASLAKKIDAAVAKLGSDDPNARAEGLAALKKFHAKAYPALLEAEKSDVAEVRRRAKELLDMIRESVSEQDLEVRPNDVLQTEDCHVTGKLEVESLKAQTSQFGEAIIRLSEVRSIRAIGFNRQKPITDALADPGSLTSYEQQVGKVFTFEVTGTTEGTVYGTNIYTTDSKLSTAAVHCGVVKAGKKGFVKVKILGQLNSFDSTTQNGVTSNPWTSPWGAFEILKK